MVALRLMLNYDRTAISVNFGLIEVFFFIIIIFAPEKKIGIRYRFFQFSDEILHCTTQSHAKLWQDGHFGEFWAD